MAKEEKEKKQGIFKGVVVNGLVRALEEGGVTIDKVDKSFRNALDSLVEDFVADNDLRKEAVTEFVRQANIPQTLEIKKDGEIKKIDGLTHSQTGDLIKIVSADMAVMIVGIPGAGKTTACEQVAEALEIPFHAMSVGMQTTKSDIMGFIDANGVYQASGFRKAFEGGGVFLMDEVDAGNPNVLVMVNSAISNGFCEFGDKMVHRHKDFRFVATANTFGTGSDMQYVGRNKLDAATLDRFVVLNWKIDEVLEETIATNEGWLTKVRNLRDAVSDSSVSLLVTPRMAIQGSKLLELEFEEDDVIKMVAQKGSDDDTTKFINRNLHDEV